MVAANVNAAIVRPKMLTGTPATFRSLAIDARLAVTIRPPAPTMTNMKYISTKIGSPRDAMNQPPTRKMNKASTSGYQNSIPIMYMESPSASAVTLPNTQRSFGPMISFGA